HKGGTILLSQLQANLCRDTTGATGHENDGGRIQLDRIAAGSCFRFCRCYFKPITSAVFVADFYVLVCGCCFSKQSSCPLLGSRGRIEIQGFGWDTGPSWGKRLNEAGDAGLQWIEAGPRFQRAGEDTAQTCCRHYKRSIPFFEGLHGI